MGKFVNTEKETVSTRIMKINSMRLIFFFITLFIYSCGSHLQNDNLPDLSQADKVKIFYKMDFDSNGKMKIAEKDIYDINKVADIKNVISYEPINYLYCISSGTMSFYHDSSHIIDIVFNTSPDFLHLAYNHNGKLNAIKLTEENAKFLDSFKELTEH